MAITKELFGKMPDGQEVQLYTLENQNAVKVKISEYAGAIVSILLPDGSSGETDVVLGYRNLEGYLNNSPYLGVTVGRSSNRIAPNTVTLAGKEYLLEANEPSCNLHGGGRGLSFRRFNSEVRGDTLVLGTTIPHMEDDFPGDFKVSVAFSLDDENQLKIEYNAVSTEDTVINLTNHSYFNLAGHSSGSIHNQQVQVLADQYTVTNAGGVPLNNAPVAGSKFDLTQPVAFKNALDQGGIDNNYLLRDKDGYKLAVVMSDPESGRELETYTSESCVQVYTASMLEPVGEAKEGAVYGQYSGVCFETQNMPNAVHILKDWSPSMVYPAGAEYSSVTTYKFKL